MLIILLLSIFGFLNAFYLYWQHKREVSSGQKMFCFIGGDCGGVVGSKYGRTFGIKNELTGMSYYILIAILVGLNFVMFSKILAFLATIFSLYLLFVQTILLKKFCSWCLIAIGINVLIFYLLLKIL